MFQFFLVDLAYPTGELMLFVSVTNLFELGFVTLAPFWIGYMMKINPSAKMKLLLVPLIPFVAATVFEFLYVAAGSERFLSDFWTNIVILLTFITGASAFVAWIVAWVMCGLDRNFKDANQEAINE